MENGHLRFLETLQWKSCWVFYQIDMTSLHCYIGWRLWYYHQIIEIWNIYILKKIIIKCRYCSKLLYLVSVTWAYHENRRTCSNHSKLVIFLVCILSMSSAKNVNNTASFMVRGVRLAGYFMVPLTIFVLTTSVYLTVLGFQYSKFRTANIKRQTYLNNSLLSKYFYFLNANIIAILCCPCYLCAANIQYFCPCLFSALISLAKLKDGKILWTGTLSFQIFARYMAHLKHSIKIISIALNKNGKAIDKSFNILK